MDREPIDASPCPVAGVPRRGLALMFGLRKIRSMKRHVVILFVLCVFYAFANQAVDDALQSVIQNGCLSNPRAAGQIEEWGVPERLFQEPSFTNLVSILNQELVNCDFAYVNALTGTVKRAAFVAALTKCGNVAYHDSLVRWFGQESLPAAANVKVCTAILARRAKRNVTSPREAHPTTF